MSHKVRPATYVELTHSLIMSLVTTDLNVSQIALLLWSCAQKKARQAETDVTREVREALDDWSHEDRGRIIAIEVVHIQFPCVMRHDGENPCPKGHHTVQMTRVIGSQGWQPENVSSKYNFRERILEVSMRHHPDGNHPEKFKIAGAVGFDNGLMEAFAKVTEKSIDAKIEDFRAELDKLFPSTPTHGKEEGHEPS